MPELSPAFRQLLERCATCGGPMPCTLHDAELREAMLRPPEREGLPWEKVERRDIATLSVPAIGIAPCADGTYLVAGGLSIYRVDPTKPEEEQEEMVGLLSTQIHEFARLADGTFVLGTADGSVVHFDPDTSKALSERPHNLGLVNVDGSAVYAIAPLPDGTCFVAGSRGRIVHVDPRKPEGERIKGVSHFPGFGDILKLRALSGGALLILTDDGLYTHRFLDRTGAYFTFHWTAGNDVVMDGMQPLPDGTVLIGGSDGRIVRIDLSKPEGQREEVLGNYGSAVYSIVLTSDHAFLVVGDSGVIAEYAIPERAMAEWRERKIDAPDVPPMPE